MATRYDLTWDADGRRWRFMHDYKRHVRSVRQLKKDGYLDPDCPETKEASYHGARAWQKTMLAELDAARLPEGHAEAIAELKRYQEHSLAHGEHLDTEAMAGLMRGLGRKEADPPPSSLVRDLVDYFRFTTVKVDRAAGDDAVPRQGTKGLSVGQAAEEWLESSVKSRQRLGHICHREVVNHRYGVKLFRDWIGDATPLADIDEIKWLAFFARLTEFVDEGRYKPTYCKHALRYSRDFMEHCIGLGRHPGLRNLRDRKMRIGISEPEKVFFSNGEIEILLGKAGGQTRLHLILMLNCGFTQKDISDLHPDEVWLGEGRIVRKRSKGRKHATVPVVSYKLWPVTARLLGEYKSSNPDRFLVTKSGRPWVDKNGKDTDSIRTQFKYLQAEVGITKSLRSFRKTSANRLGKRPEFIACQQYFLGHAPGTVAQRHYVEQADQSIFDQAVDWLQGELGITSLS